MQAAVPVVPDDTPAALAARVLAQEHVIYPRAARWFLEDRLVIAGGVVRVAGQDAQLVVAAP
jgi:phosphoribosylglycinamide formyltransferase-1